VIREEGAGGEGEEEEEEEEEEDDDDDDDDATRCLCYIFITLIDEIQQEVSSLLSVEFLFPNICFILHLLR